MIRILVIDDEKKVCDLLKKILEDAGCEAVTASRADDGLRLFDEGGFDGVFTELSMPGMSGWEFARVIRARNSQMPLAIITGCGEAVSTVAREVAEVDWLLSKPFSVAQIVEIAMEISRRRDEQTKANSPAYSGRLGNLTPSSLDPALVRLGLG